MLKFLKDCWNVIKAKDFWLMVFIVLFLSQILDCRERVIYVDTDTKTHCENYKPNPPVIED